MDSVKVRIEGVPVPQGSLDWFGRGKATHQNEDELKAWRRLVALTVRDAMMQTGMKTAPKGTPISLRVEYHLPRPKHHFSVIDGRVVALVRPSAPALPTVKPDLDKLTRAIGDALSGVAYVDDAQIVESSTSKWYSPTPNYAFSIIEVRTWQIS